MMRFFKKSENEGAVDVKSIRDRLLYAIRQKLSKLEGGEGGHITGITLFLAPGDEERALYEAAVFYEEEGRFKNEIQRIADDYGLGLPSAWEFKLESLSQLPAESQPLEGLKAGMRMYTVTRSKPSALKASLLVMEGEAEQEVYPLDPGSKRLNIGRDRKVVLPGGFYRENHICFPVESGNKANKFISRQHAHIEYDEASAQFLLFADEGGVPPQNKIKVKRKDEALPVKLQSTQVPHLLSDGDQIILGESALLQFKTNN